MKKLVVFGTGKIAEVIFYYAKEECGYDVVAFTVDESFITEPSFLGLPVLSFNSIDEKYSPENYDMFVAVGYHDLNKVREIKCEEAEAKGYKLVSIISPEAKVPKN